MENDFYSQVIKERYRRAEKWNEIEEIKERARKEILSEMRQKITTWHRIKHLFGIHRYLRFPVRFISDDVLLLDCECVICGKRKEDVM